MREEHFEAASANGRFPEEQKPRAFSWQGSPRSALRRHRDEPVGDVHPRAGRAERHAQQLNREHAGAGIPVDGVDPAPGPPVVDHGCDDEQIGHESRQHRDEDRGHRRRADEPCRSRGGQKQQKPSADSCLKHRHRRDEHQALVQLRLLHVDDGGGEQGGEQRNGREGHDRERACRVTRAGGLQPLEAADGHAKTDEAHSGRERHAGDPELAVAGEPAGGRESGLPQKEQQPAVEEEGVEMRERWNVERPLAPTGPNTSERIRSRR